MARRVHAQTSLSESLKTWILRALLRVSGGIYAAFGVFCALALFTYSVNDPSLNTATSHAPRNLMGYPGAWTADLLLQTLGAASMAFLIPTTFWGARLAMRGWPNPMPVLGWARMALAPFMLLVIAGFATAWPQPESWPFRVGLGGFIGEQIWAFAIWVWSFAPRPSGLAALTTGLLGGAGFFFIMGVRGRDLISSYREAQALTRRAGQALNWGWEWAEARFNTREAVDADPAQPKVSTAPQPAGTVDAPASEDDFIVERAVPEDDASVEAKKRRIIRKDNDQNQSAREGKEAQPKLRLDRSRPYEFPALGLLTKAKPGSRLVISDESLDENARLLEGVLSDFGVRGEIINVRPGPVVTLYELEPAAGVKSSRVIGLADDIARSMSAVAARVAVVPGRNVIGIELPNVSRETVYLREILSTPEYESGASALTLALGKGIGGEPVSADLARMPHLLIAGTTGSGKSVGINTMILSLLYRLSPEQCKLILIDPKMLELSVYEGIPHLLSPVVTDPRKAVVALKWTVREMEDRYKKMSKLGVRNIAGFNEKLSEAKARGETPQRTVHTGYDPDTGEPVYETEELEFEPLPFIVVVIDEMADLMIVAGKDIEGAVQRLAQMARAAGIHLIMATQRPSVDVITGTIKANFPTRISFQVTSKIDSRTILGEQGGEQLLGQGDMLFMAGGGRLQRVHGPFVSDDEVEKIVKHLKKQGKPEYVQDVTEGDLEGEFDSGSGGLGVGGNTSSGDALYDQAVAIVARDRKASTSYIQRRLQIGYNRAATLIERMEQEGVVGPANHAGKREIFLPEPSV